MAGKVKQCVTCGENFEPNSSMQKTCGKKCALERKRYTQRMTHARIRSGGPVQIVVREKRICKCCGQEFNTANKNRVSCSQACMEVLIAQRHQSQKAPPREKRPIPTWIRSSDKPEIQRLHEALVRSEVL